MLGDLSPDERSRRFAQIAEELIGEARRTNTQALGRPVPFTTFVDGQAGAPLTSVRPDGGIIFTEFELLIDVLAFIGTQLQKFSPVKSGRYQRSHVLLADGVPMDLDTPALVPQIQVAEEFVFINTVPYARKIERGLSQQAPDGVYQAVANIARRRYSKVARITFTYRSIVEGGGRGERNPAIIVRLG